MTYIETRKAALPTTKAKTVRLRFGVKEAYRHAVLMQRRRSARRRKAAQFELLRVARHALNHPETWIDTSAMSDDDFLALQQQGKQPR